MIDILLNFIIKLIGILADIVMYPIIALFTALIPNLDTLINSVLNFIVNNIMPYFSFAKSCFMNITGVPQSFVTILWSYAIFKITLYTAMLSYRCILKLYNYFKM